MARPVALRASPNAFHAAYCGAGVKSTPPAPGFDHDDHPAAGLAQGLPRPHPTPLKWYSYSARGSCWCCSCGWCCWCPRSCSCWCCCERGGGLSWHAVVFGWLVLKAPHSLLREHHSNAAARDMVPLWMSGAESKQTAPTAQECSSGGWFVPFQNPQ